MTGFSASTNRCARASGKAMRGSSACGARVVGASRASAGGGGPAKTGARGARWQGRRRQLVEQAEQQVGRRHADAGHASAAVGAAHPHADHPCAVEADRPAVAETVGRAGLVGDAPRARAKPSRRRHAGQDVDDGIGAGAREQRRLRPGRGGHVGALDQRLDGAAVGERRIGRDEVFQRDADAAERHRQARGRVVRRDERQPGVAEARGKGEPARPSATRSRPAN